jgi:hypothetical protein
MRMLPAINSRMQTSFNVSVFFYMVMNQKNVSRDMFTANDGRNESV